MLSTLTCISCPRGCDMEARIEEGRLVALEGAACAKGRRYAEEEISDPKRVLTTSVLVRGGAGPLACVRSSGPVPKGRLQDAIEEIRKVSLSAPVRIGQIAVADLLGLGIDLIVTRNVAGAAGAPIRAEDERMGGGECA